MIKVTVGNNTNRTTVIIPENKTLREVFTENEIDFSIAQPMLDGCSLRPGDLDKTFAELGVTDRCFLIAVANKDNAASATVSGAAVIIRSDLKLEDIQRLEKYKPEALTILKDGEADFRIGSDPAGYGSINRYGAAFSPTGSADGKGTITMMAPEEVSAPEDIRTWFVENYGQALLKVQQLETLLTAELAEVNGQVERMYNSVRIG